MNSSKESLQSGDPKNTELSLLALSLNSQFIEGATAFDILDDIRKFPRPICVDFNNVIADSDGLIANPDAVEGLQRLSRVGNIFIVTTAIDTTHIINFLHENHLWSDELVVMAKPSWLAITQWAEVDYSKRGQELLEIANRVKQEYIEQLASEGLLFSTENFNMPPAYKTVAPLFGKKWAVPIIDDSRSATDNNPNMHGIEVQIWEPTMTSDKWLIHENERKPTFLESASYIEKYFDSLSKLGLLK